MKKILERSICVVLAMCMIITMMVCDIDLVKAEVPADRFDISHDENKYEIQWASRRKVSIYSKHDSWWGAVNVGDYLGNAILKTYYLMPLEELEGECYGIAGCQVIMNPVDIEGTKLTGMSQYAMFGLSTVNEDSRVCSPTATLINAVATENKTTSGSMDIAAGLEYNFKSKAWAASGNVNLGTGWSSTSSYTYNISNVILTQKKQNGDFATWAFDYKSKDGNATWNAFLCSSSEFMGQVVYVLDAPPYIEYMPTGRPTLIKYDIRFGAGNAGTGKVESNWVDGDRSLGTISEIKSITW